MTTVASRPGRRLIPPSNPHLHQPAVLVFPPPCPSCARHAKAVPGAFAPEPTIFIPTGEASRTYTDPSSLSLIFVISYNYRTSCAELFVVITPLSSPPPPSPSPHSHRKRNIKHKMSTHIFFLWYKRHTRLSMLVCSPSPPTQHMDLSAWRQGNLAVSPATNLRNRAPNPLQHAPYNPWPKKTPPDRHPHFSPSTSLQRSWASEHFVPVTHGGVGTTRKRKRAASGLAAFHCCRCELSLILLCELFTVWPQMSRLDNASDQRQRTE